MHTLMSVVLAMWFAGWLVFIIHCNLWYWSLPKDERRRLDADILDKW